MIKALIKYLLFFCILLLSAHSQLAALPLQESALNAYTARGLRYARFDNFQHNEAYIHKSSSSGTEKSAKIEVSEIEIEEEDDDEWISAKKFLESSSYLTTLFYTHLSEYLSQSIKTRLSFYKQFSYLSFPESLYLVLRVFRL